MEIDGYLRIIRKSWIPLLIFTLLGAFVAGAYSVSQPPKYSAHASVQISSRSTPISIYEELNLESLNNQITSRLIEKFDSLSNNEAVIATQNLSSIDISSQGEDSAAVTEAVNQSALELNNLFKSNQLISNEFDIETIYSSRSERVANSPKLPTLIAIGLVSGFFSCLTFVVFREIRNRRVFTSRELSTSTNIPVLSTNISPEIYGPVEDFAIEELLSEMQIQIGSVNKFQVIVLSTPNGELPILPFAKLLAQRYSGLGKTAVVIDSFASALESESNNVSLEILGLSDVLNGTSSFKSILASKKNSNSNLIGPGTKYSELTSLLLSRNPETVLNELQSFVEIVILVAPPLSDSNSSLLLAGQESIFLLLVEKGKSELNNVTRSLNQLSKSQLNKMGVLLMNSNSNKYFRSE